MKKYVSFLAVVVSLVMTLFPVSWVQAGSLQSQHTFIERVNGRYAQAFFNTIVDDCIYTDTFVQVEDSIRVGVGGRTTPTMIASLRMYRYDACVGGTLLDGSGNIEIDPSMFQLDARFTSAHLEATIPLVDDVSGATVNVLVDLDWSSADDLLRNDQHYQDTTGYCKYILNITGKNRSANAVGIISEGSANFASATSAFANLGFTTFGNFYVGCGT